MLASKYRLKGPIAFKRVQMEGKIIQSDSFGVAYLNRNDLEVSRFGYIISTKISKLSVHRNKIRRAINEAVRFNLSYIKPGYDVVFLAKPAALKNSTVSIMDEVKESLIKIGILQ